MIDLHCHILPGVDDGSPSMDASCRMASIALSAGVDTIVCTPHCNTRNEQTNYRSPELTAVFEALRKRFEQYELPVQLYLGAEVLMHGDMRPLFEERRLPTLNNSRYMLTEFFFDDAPVFMNMNLELELQYGYIPVIAHPERYEAVQRDPLLAQHWADLGCVLQLNKGSLLGKLGERSYDTGVLLLRRGLAGVIASDAHNCSSRTPDMERLCRFLDRYYSDEVARLLLFDNPDRILHNLSLIPVICPEDAFTFE